MDIEMHGHIDPLYAVFQHGVRQNTDEPTFAPQVRAYWLNGAERGSHQRLNSAYFIEEALGE